MINLNIDCIDKANSSCSSSNPIKNKQSTTSFRANAKLLSEILLFLKKNNLQLSSQPIGIKSFKADICSKSSKIEIIKYRELSAIGQTKLGAELKVLENFCNEKGLVLIYVDEEGKRKFQNIIKIPDRFKDFFAEKITGNIS